MPRVVTFGELMLRLSPPGFERLLQSPMLVATFGGGEANVAVSLALFGIESVYVTALPKNPIGDAAVRALRAEGVRTDGIVRSGNRVGVYYAEGGAAQRGSAVTYDRANSSIADMKPDAVDWAATMKGADWLHVTGITPALGANGAEGTRRACAAARAAGAKVSVDLNFRKKLWTEAQAQAVMGPLMRDVDIVIANEEDLQSVLGVHVPGTDVTSGQLDVSGYRQAAEQVTRDFGPKMVAITLRESLSASDNGWSAVLWEAGTATMHRSQHYDIRLVDRIGGGDSFAAGLIYGLITGRTPEAGAPLRRRRQRAETEHPGRLQPRERRRGRSAGGGRCFRASAEIGNLQLPTPNFQLPRGVGRTTGWKADQRACWGAFHPDGSTDSPWELEVGRCELIRSHLKPTMYSAPPHQPRPHDPVGRARVIAIAAPADSSPQSSAPSAA